MPCHRDIAKLEGIKSAADDPVNLTVSSDNNEVVKDVKPVVKSELKKETDKIGSLSVPYKPRNRSMTALYKKALQVLLKAKMEAQTKTERQEKTDRISSHIHSVSFDAAKVVEHARARRVAIIRCACEFCGEQCRSQCAYIRHRTEYHPGQPYFCKYCNRKYLSANGCYKHEWYHSALGCTCVICGRKFKLQSELGDHLPTHDTSTKVSCKNCGKLFSTRCTLKRHSEVHMGLTFTCSDCDRTYATKERLGVHFRGFHGD